MSRIPRDARWMALSTSRLCVPLSRHALAPKASTCAHTAASWIGGEQHQPRPRMTHGELPHLGEPLQGVRIEDRNVRSMARQRDRHASRIDAGGEDLDALVATQQLAQASLQEIIEAGDHDRD